MPATVCQTSPSSSQTGAESTNSCEIRDKKCWFSDVDIDNYLNYSLTEEGFCHLNPCIVLCLAENADASVGLPDCVFKSHTIFCPLNIDNCHWILFVYDKNDHSYYIDPIRLYFNKSRSFALSKSLTICLNKILDLNILLQYNPNTPYLEQTNSYDCGPLICLYADRLQFGIDLNKRYNVDNIRRIVFKLSDPNIKPTYKGHGTGIDTYFGESNISDILSNWYDKRSDIFVLSKTSTKNIIDKNRDYIIENFNYKQFKLIKFVIGFFYFEKFAYLFVFCLEMAKSRIFSISGNQLPLSVSFLGFEFNDLLNKLFFDGKVSFYCNQEINYEFSISSDKNQIIATCIWICNSCFGELQVSKDAILNQLIDFNESIRTKTRINNDSITFINSKINDQIFQSFFISLGLPFKFFFISTSIAKAMIDDCWQHVTTFLDIKSLCIADVVFCIFRPPSHHLLLLIIDHTVNEYYILNPTTLISKIDHNKLGEYLVTRICELGCKLKQITVLNTIPHDCKGSGLFSNLLICSFIENFSLNYKLTGIDLNKVCEKVSNISQMKIRDASSLPIRGLDIDDQVKITMKDRIKKCNFLLQQLANSDPDSIIKCIELHLPNKKKTISNKNPYLGNKLKKDLPDKVDIRQDFINNMKGTFYKIINDGEINHRPDIEEIEKYFTHDEPNTSIWNLEKYCKTADEKLILGEISCLEILYVLKNSNNSAPGSDGISFKNLLYLDPEGKLLCHLFNKILVTKSTPKSWKVFKTVLIPKPDKDLSQVTSWRPIALLDTSYKVFTSILCNRLNCWIVSNNLLHPNQKGASKHEGCVEHNAILTSVLENSTHTQKYPASIGWLDIKDAFGSVPHRYLWNMLEFMGVDNNFIEILKSLYSGSSSFYCCGPIITPNIAIKRGVRQGCPISMLLFSIFINPVLVAIENLQIPKYHINATEIDILAYADDIALVATNQLDLQVMVNTAIEICNMSGLKFQPGKCAFLTVPQLQNSNSIDVEGFQIRRLANGEFYQYLGVPVGVRHDQSPYQMLEQLINDLRKIADSDLFQWQKLQAYQIFLHPRLIFSFRTREVKISALEDSKKPGRKYNDISSHLRYQIRHILKLPLQSEKCYLYCGVADGGIGLTDLHDEYSTQSIVQVFRLLTTPCNTTRKIIIDSLLRIMMYRLNDDEVDVPVCLSWLNGTINQTNNTGKKTWWHRPKAAIKYFKNKLKINLQLEYNEGKVHLRLTTAKRGTIIITDKDRKNLSHLLHRSIFDFHADMWLESKNSGFFAALAPTGHRTNKHILKGAIGTFSWNFIHKAKLNVISVNARPFISGVKRLCRRCHASDETLTHAIQTCVPNMIMVTQRHDACLQRIYENLKNPDTIVIINERCPYIKNCNLRVDLLITHVNSKKIFLVDIKCPIDTPKNFEEADKKNLEKYSDLRNQLQKLFKDHIVELYTLIIGSLGTPALNAQHILVKIGIQDAVAKKIIKFCSTSNIEHSARIWNYHVSGNLIKFNDRTNN